MPKQFKKGLVLGLLCRAWRICSSYTKFHEEVCQLKKCLLCNGYPENFIDSCIRSFLNKCREKKMDIPTFGPAKKLVTVVLPYIGTNGDKIKRQIKRIHGCSAQCLDISIIFKPMNKLSRLSKLKSKLELLSNSGVVYKVDCDNCDEFYIGMTTRRLRDRMNEHKESESSAIQRHMTSCRHTMKLDNPEVLASDSVQSRLYIKEALYIKDYSAYNSLNGTLCSCDLKLW